MIPIIAIIFIASQFFDHALNFEKEKIAINVSSGECMLTGDYYFKNNSPQPCTRTIFYPLINTVDLPFPSSISVTDVYENKALKYTISKNGVAFALKLSSYDTKVIRIEYHQKTMSNRFEYILTTTHFWKKPLRRAEFSISMPKHLVLSSISMSYESTQTNSNERRYYIRRENFMPEKNLFFEWRIGP